MESDTSSTNNSRRFRILSLDGGGLRGIFGATLLARIERQTGKHIREYFDLIAGTSTGAILGLALAYDMPAQAIADLYENHRYDIFDHPRSDARLLLLGGARHNAEPLYRTIRDHLGGADQRQLEWPVGDN